MGGENLWGFGLIPEPVRERDAWEAIPDLLRTGLGAYQTAQQREAQRAAAAAKMAEDKRQFDVAQRGLTERAAGTLGFQKEEVEAKRQAEQQKNEAIRVKEAAAQRIAPLTDWEKIYGKAAGEYPEVTQIQRELYNLKPYMAKGAIELPRGSIPGEAPPIGPLRPLPDVFSSISDRTAEALRQGIAAKSRRTAGERAAGRTPPISVEDRLWLANQTAAYNAALGAAKETVDPEKLAFEAMKAPGREQTLGDVSTAKRGIQRQAVQSLASQLPVVPPSRGGKLFATPRSSPVVPRATPNTGAHPIQTFAAEYRRNNPQASNEEILAAFKASR